jgi:hypothetical protein
MKWLIVLAVLIAGVVYLVKNPQVLTGSPTTKSHYGTATLFTKAAEHMDASAMRQYCKGAAADQCNSIVTSIRNVHSSVSKALVEVGGASGTRTSARSMLYGPNGDMFMEIAYTLEKDGDQWLVSEMGSREIK